MDDKTAIWILQQIRRDLDRAGESSDEAMVLAIQAIEALYQARRDIDEATTPAEMVMALYAVTGSAAQSGKIADEASGLRRVNRKVARLIAAARRSVDGPIDDGAARHELRDAVNMLASERIDDAR